MLSPDEYENIKHDRDNILHFQQTGRYKGSCMQLFDFIRQKHGMRPLCFSCDGDKMEALNDIYHMMIEYEETIK